MATFGSAALDVPDGEWAEWLRARPAGPSRRTDSGASARMAKSVVAQAEAIVGARVNRRLRRREYLVQWKSADSEGEGEGEDNGSGNGNGDDDSDGEPVCTWEPFRHLVLAPDAEGRPQMSAALDAMVARWDRLSEAELQAEEARDEAERAAAVAPLGPGCRVVVDCGADEGFAAGWVLRTDGSGEMVTVAVDGRAGGAQQELMMRRAGQVFAAPPPTTMRVGSLVRVAYDEDDGPPTCRAAQSPTQLRRRHASNTAIPCVRGPRRRWYYGKVTRICRGHELVDVRFDNGEALRCAPTFHVLVC
eukprot:7380680-Prymnesium_polylepis.2